MESVEGQIIGENEINSGGCKKCQQKKGTSKKQIGGIIGECTFFSKSEDNANLLLKRYKEEKCNNDDIRRFGPKAFIQAGLIKLTFNTGNPQPLLELFNIKDLIHFL